MYRLEHINIRVPSIRKTQEFLAIAFPDFYERGSGYSETYGYWSHFGNDSTYLALLQASPRGKENSAGIPDYHYEDSYRLMHVGMEVEELDAVKNRLRQAGIEPSITEEESPHPYRRRVYYLDGNGMEWEFIQYLSDRPEERNSYYSDPIG